MGVGLKTARARRATKQTARARWNPGGIKKSSSRLEHHHNIYLKIRFAATRRGGAERDGSPQGSDFVPSC